MVNVVVVPSSPCTHQTWLVIVQAKFDGTEDNHVESTTLILEVGVDKHQGPGQFQFFLSEEE